MDTISEIKIKRSKSQEFNDILLSNKIANIAFDLITSYLEERPTIDFKTYVMFCREFELNEVNLIMDYAKKLSKCFM